MIYTEKNKDGLIYAYAEWWIVDTAGRIDKDGEYIFVNDVWIHSAYRHNGIMKRFIRRGAAEYPQAKYMYYQRSKYNFRLKSYSRRQLKEES